MIKLNLMCMKNQNFKIIFFVICFISINSCKKDSKTDSSWLLVEQENEEFGYVTAIKIDHNGALWFTQNSGNNNALEKYDGTTWQQYDLDPKYFCWDMVIDAQNQKWICTGDGILKFNGTDWTKYFEDKSFRTAVVDKDNHIWFLCVMNYENAVYQFDGTNWTIYDLNLLNPNSGNLSGWLLCINSDNYGNIFVGTAASQGLWKFDGLNWTIMNEIDGLTKYAIKSISFDVQNHMWIGTTVGISYYDGSTWQTYKSTSSYPFTDDLAGNDINAITIDATGSLWIGYNRMDDYGGRITKFDGNKFETYFFPTGCGDMTNCITIDKEGRKWIGFDGSINNRYLVFTGN